MNHTNILPDASSLLPNHLPETGLRERLMQRVRKSHARESQFHTIRRDAGQWSALQFDARQKPLADTPAAHSALVELASGATLEQPRGWTMQEVVLLVGHAALGDALLACGDAVCAPHDAAHLLRAGAAGARLYLRLSAPQASPQQTLQFSTLVDDATWQDFCPGVRIKELWNGGERRSVLVRMRAGSHVSSHDHSLEEECMMLAGEAFIGDTLLRGGEYQLAPQGSRHGAVQTDVGALFYVHGSLDPAAYAPAPAART